MTVRKTLTVQLMEAELRIAELKHLLELHEFDEAERQAAAARLASVPDPQPLVAEPEAPRVPTTPAARNCGRVQDERGRWIPAHFAAARQLAMAGGRAVRISV